MTEKANERQVDRAEFERLFGVDLPPRHQVDIRISEDAKAPDVAKGALNYRMLIGLSDSDHCGSSSSSTLSLEFFVSISEETWDRALDLVTT
jgi:hypothetical protein